MGGRIMSAGPWFLASYPGECSWGDEIEEGEEIRADGDGGWEHRDCAEIHGCGTEDEPSDENPTIEELFGF